MSAQSLPDNVVRSYAEMSDWEKYCHDYSGTTVQALAAEVLQLRAQVERVRSGFGPDDPAGCPGGHGSQCCGHHVDCARALGLCP
jgi:hypothetical protein